MSEFIINSEQVQRINRMTGIDMRRYDMPEIVRCHDCKWRAGQNRHAVNPNMCLFFSCDTEPDGFCKWGGKRMSEQTCGTCLYRELHGLNKRAEENGWPVTISCYCEIIEAHVNSYDKACPAYEYGVPQMFYDDMDDF